MLVSEIVKSCSNDKVAAAALASIGGLFAARLTAHADNEGLEVGRMAAEMVHHFAQNANARDLQALRSALVGTDQPVLSGFRHILEAGLHAASAAETQRTGGKASGREPMRMCRASGASYSGCAAL